MSKFIEANERIAEKVVEGYKKIEDGVVSGYKKSKKAPLKVSTRYRTSNYDFHNRTKV